MITDLIIIVSQAKAIVNTKFTDLIFKIDITIYHF